MPISEARAVLPEVLDRVDRGEEIRAAIAAGRQRPISRGAGITVDRADELVSAIRADRDLRP
ncbi:MAG: hypothetical protein ACYDC0_16680 [Acidimicrobiales bacterium]